MPTLPDEGTTACTTCEAEGPSRPAPRLIDPAPLAAAHAATLAGLGYDVEGAHFKDTPRRVAAFLASWHTTYRDPPTLTVFPNEGRYDGLVVEHDIPFHAMCAHHGLPFFGRALVAYLPDAKLLGLSKLARVVDHFAHRYTTQEEITGKVAEHLLLQLQPRGVAVILSGEHLCMSMRGVQKPGTRTTTSVLRGACDTDPNLRSEVLTLAGWGGGR